jgi:ArsR family transcriptional regulator
MTTPATPIAADVLHSAANVIKCLGHPMRLRLLELLEHGERTVSDLVEGTCATQAAVSQQLGVLRGHGVVAARRDGPYVRYHITEPKVRHILDCIRNAQCVDAAPSPDA